MKKFLILIAALAIIISSCQPKTIGGDKDKNGCLIAAGYTWNETITACVRAWELDENQAKAAQFAVAPMSVMPRTITKVETLKCPGCFIVYIQSGDSQKSYPVKIIDWKISNEITSFEECIAAGNPVMESYPRQCRAGEKTFTEEVKHICTEEESLEAACTMDYNPVCGEFMLNTGKTIYQTFGNGCSACATMKVISYVAGECGEKESKTVYLSTSAEQCSRMGVWQCEDGYSVFSDETGCGCKKNLI